jgi:putative DNA primase/helicase
MTAPRRRTLAERIAERDQAARKGNQKAQKDKRTPTPSRNGRPAPEAQQDDVHLTDLGNARRVVERHGHDLRYIHPWKIWLVWDGRRWAQDVTGEVVRRVKETQAALFRSTVEAIEALGGDAQAPVEKTPLGKLLLHALKWEDARAITRTLDLARSELGIPALPADLDRDPFLLNVRNGTIDLKTGQLRPHQREDLITKLAPVKYDENANCPRWLGFLDRIMDGNTALIRYVQRVVGYGLTGDVSEQCLWFFHGGGANGKSTFLGTILAMLGDYGMQAVSDLLMAKNHESHPTERADLFGKRFVATIETEEGKRMAEALMKQVTGGDPVRARKMRQDFFEFLPTHKIVLAVNHKPVVRGTDHGVWRRIKLVPFTVTISDSEKDKNLPAKLKAELPGILAWAIRGCLDWQQHGLGEPDEVRQATSQYQAEQDVIQGFLDDCCQIYPEAKVNSSALLAAYTAWSGDKSMTAQAFRKRMKDKGFESKEGAGGRYFWRGLHLKQTTDEGDDSGGEWR